MVMKGIATAFSKVIDGAQLPSSEFEEPENVKELFKLSLLSGLG